MNTSNEAAREKSEKQKESYKKAQAQIQKSQRDEKKAKNDNTDLFIILQKFIQNPYYESLVPTVTDLLHITMPSRVILALISLIYPDASNYIFHAIDKPDRIHTMQKLYRYDELWQFQESNLHESLRDWMSLWIDSMDRFFRAKEVSVVMHHKFITLCENSEADILKSISALVYFFFEGRNIQIPITLTDAYAQFILKNMLNTIGNSIEQYEDKDLLEPKTVRDMLFF